MILLKTLGGLSVQADGVSPTGAAQQRKPLALLALLAASRGMSRDKLIAYLWPESDADHARNTLKQVCHALRRDLHPELFLGTVELRLNPDVVTSDIGSLEDTLDHGDPARAVAAYSGPFLDGFHLAGAAEFERWVEETRAALKRRVGEALESLATHAASVGDVQPAVQWWRRLAALDPLNSRVALGLVHALAAAGDRAGALQAARVHETLLREELGAAPDAALVELSERLRAEAEPARASRRRAVPEPAASEDAAARREASTEAGAPSPAPGRASTARHSSMVRKPVAVGLALLVGALLTGGWLLFGMPFGARSAETAGAPKKVVILPFTNLGAADDEYFADGIAEEITARLAAMGGLRVIGSTSAQAYKGTKKTIAEIGHELGVDYILEGSVRWQKPAQGQATVRVTPQLVSTTDGTHLWAEVYDEPLDEIFRVQSDIARKVARALDVTLGEPQRRVVEGVPTSDLGAYDYYLRGIDYRRRGSEERFARAAVRMYEKAVEVDSNFALAYAALAHAHNQMYVQHYDGSQERRARVKRAVDRAFELEPDLPEARLALGAYYMAGLDYEGALREWARAESSRSGYNLSLPRAVVRRRQGKLREALTDFERAWQLDPASTIVATNYAIAYDLLRDFPRAEALYDRAIALGPDRSNPYWWKAWLYLRWDGRTERARGVLREEARAAGVAGDPLLLLTRVLVEVFDRKHGEAIAVLTSDARQVIADQFRFIPRAQLYAQIHGLMRRHDLERAYYDSARTFALKRIEEQPDDPRLHSALGIAYAGLGRREEAIQEGQKGVELLPISKDAMRGYYREWDLARIYVMVGEHDAALDRLEYLLSIPGPLTAAWLRMDPDWDPLRGHRRFEKMVRRGE